MRNKKWFSLIGITFLILPIGFAQEIEPNFIVTLMVSETDADLNTYKGAVWFSGKGNCDEDSYIILSTDSYVEVEIIGNTLLDIVKMNEEYILSPRAPDIVISSEDYDYRNPHILLLENMLPNRDGSSIKGIAIFDFKISKVARGSNPRLESVLVCNTPEKAYIFKDELQLHIKSEQEQLYLLFEVFSLAFASLAFMISFAALRKRGRG